MLITCFVHIYIFSAIIFALGYTNDVKSLPREFQTFSGSVEITFNSGRNDVVEAFFKNFEGAKTGNKISLRRTIQHPTQQIEYFLNGISIERLKVKHFLQIFGFAASYPFQYAVNSNDIATVELSDDKGRLHWLKDCCGVDEFYEKRDKSLRILNETEQEIQKIDVLLMKYNVQLTIFASSETQQIYQNWVKREKELGHFKRLYRIKALKAEYQQLNADIEKHTNLITTNKMSLVQNVENAKEMRRQMKLIVDRVTELRMNERQLMMRIEECERENSTLEDSLVDLQSLVQQGSLAEDLSMQEKQMYREKIDETSHQIGDIDAEIERIAVDKRKIDDEISEMDAEAATILINCQQNKRLNTQFRTATKRNEHLSVLIKRTKNAIARENRNVNRLKKEIQNDETEINLLKTELTKHNQQLDEMNADDETQSFYQQQEMYKSLEHQRT